MNGADFAALVGPALASALESKGFQRLMPVQQAVLDPALAGRDLRVSSQTGSGKTIAIGLSLRDLVEGATAAPHGVARPRALVVVPTRELARQVQEELTWLYAPLKARVAAAVGGSDAREERRAFAAGPAVVVGTPGRLLDHLNRGSIDSSKVGAVVLDEADQMLDLGFKEDLEAILKHAPPDHLTHLVSATFAHEVRALADRVQKDPARIEATPLGTANADIDHLIHLVANPDRLGAMVNLLLATPGAQTLVFARTRADVAAITRALSDAGFQVRALSGEMEQRERNLALAAFKSGGLHALIATDVAARGIDVQDIARVIHAEPPTDSDSYTHRSGRTGRAGKKGTSSVLVAPAGLARASGLLRRAGVRFRIEPIPTAKSIRAAIDERLFTELTGASEDAVAPDPRMIAVAERIVASADVVPTLARLLERSRYGGPEPFDVRPIEAPRETLERPFRSPRDVRDGRYDARAPRDREPRMSSRDEHPRAPRDGQERPERGPRAPKGGEWVPFRFTWGSEHGADPRRLLAMACRRGGIQAGDVGIIHVARHHSIVQIAGEAASSFANATREPDPRDPRVTIRVEAGGMPASAGAPARHHTPARAHEREAPRATREYVPPPPRSKAPARPVERPSRPRVTADRPSKSRVADRPGRAVAADRPSKARVADRPSRASVADRPSKARVADRPSKSHVADRPSRAGGHEPPKRKRHD